MYYNCITDDAGVGHAGKMNWRRPSHGVGSGKTFKHISKTKQH